MIVSLLFPVLMMILLVGSFGNQPDPDFGGVGGTDFYVPVYTAATIAVLGLLGLPTHLAAYRQSGVLQRLRASGLPPVALMGAQAAVMVALVVVGVAVMLAIGFGAYDLTAPQSTLGVMVALAAGTAAFAGLGLALGTLMPTARAAQGLGLALFFGLFFIAGGGPPPAILPESINTFVDWTPMGPLVTAVSDPWHGHGSNAAALAALLAIALLGAAIAQRRLSRL